MKDSNISEKHRIISLWVRQYSDPLYSWAFYRTSDEALAADLVQDTFLAAFQHYERFGGSSTAKTWLFAILKNKITDHFRRVVKSRSLGLGSDHEGAVEWFDDHGQWKKAFRPQRWDTEDENLLDDVAFQEALAGCLRRLPSAWASCMQLKYLSEKESNVICQQLNISASNLWQILHRAKLQLRACLEKSWFKPN